MGDPFVNVLQDTPLTVALVDTVHGLKPVQGTEATLHLTDRVLHVRFVCHDIHIWSTFTERDEPLFEEEAVEVFIGMGAEDPTAYFEFEVSPEGVLWDGVVLSPNLSRDGMVSDPRWDSEFVQWGASQHIGQNIWEAWVSIDLEELRMESVRLGLDCSTPDLPTDWRVNLYRIDRPENAKPELTAWRPTMSDPADFHVPSRFVHLKLEV